MKHVHISSDQARIIQTLLNIQLIKIDELMLEVFRLTRIAGNGQPNLETVCKEIVYAMMTAAITANHEAKDLLEKS